MKQGIIFILGLLLCCIILYCLLFVVDWESIFGEWDHNPYVPGATTHVEGTENYDWSRLYVYKIFPMELPDFATEITYSYYKVYEQLDIYLELKFPDRETMDLYMDQIKDQIGEKIVIKENHQNPSYTDYFSYYSSFHSGGKDFHYYEIEVEHEEKVNSIDGEYSVISFSYDDLTVVTTRMSGRLLDFVPYNDNSGSFKIPKYFTRFGIDVTKDSEYYVYFPES